MKRDIAITVLSLAIALSGIFAAGCSENLANLSNPSESSKLKNSEDHAESKEDSRIYSGMPNLNDPNTSKPDNDPITENDYIPEQYTAGMVKDYFIYDKVLYTNCYTCPVDWVIDNDRYGYNFDFGKVGELVTTIKGKADLREFDGSTANILPVGTEIYEFPDNGELLIAKPGNDYIPYMKIVEG